MAGSDVAVLMSIPETFAASASTGSRLITFEGVSFRFTSENPSLTVFSAAVDAGTDVA